MEDAAGQTIRLSDHVTFKSAGAHGDRGRLLRNVPGKSRTLAVLCVGGAAVEANAGDLTVVDRSYHYPGEVVASASDLGGQFGVVTGATTALDLVRLGGDQQAASEVVAGGVSPSELRRVRELSLGDYVVSGPWLGQVVEVSLDVDVLFDDGAVCRVTRAERKLKAVDKDCLGRQTNCVFYPGQRVVAHRSFLKASRWLEGQWKPSRYEGIITKVDMAGVLVYWAASSHLGTNRALVQASAPPAYQRNPGNLTFFRSPVYCYWSIGDRCFFRTPGHHRPTTDSTASAGNVDAPSSSSSSPLAVPGPTLKHRKRKFRIGDSRRKRRVDDKHELLVRSMCVAATHTTADVLWQDGTRQHGVQSALLVPVVLRNEHDFLPGQYVFQRVASGDDITRPAYRIGIVRSLDYKDQTVRVAWFKQAREPLEVDYEETLSAYTLGRCFHDNAFYGDVVVRLLPTESCADGDSGDGSTEEQMAAGSSKKAAGADDLSWVGHVVDLCGGHVLVKWGDGNTSKVMPHEIAVVKELKITEMQQEMGDDWVYHDEDMDDAQVDTAQEAPAAPAAAIDINGNGEGTDDDSDNVTGAEDGLVATRAMTSRVGAMIRAVIRIAGGVLAHGRRYVVGEPVSLALRSDSSTTENVEAPAPVSGGHGGRMEAVVGTAAASACRSGEGSDDSCRFQQFDVVQSPPDHHYLDNTDQGIGGGRNWTKRVQKEWKILDNNLPDTIFVRAFEDRMDLLRMVMVGASGTPSHDGLFFFDLQLPPPYPAVPPLVKYRSFGLRVNPNLYPSGTVCLSLLNTFGGEGVELWSPESSSVLQVVVSIQGLVLTAQPYYNEAGYGAQVGTPEGRRNELPYSENAYLLNLQTMLHLLRRPPAGFEAFVRDHFRRRGQHVLRACEAYLDGCVVGTLDGEARAAERSRERPCSVGFRLALTNVVPRLVDAFTAIGAQGCDQFIKHASH
ncbi:hypothetical protein ACP70R_032568 [Stipagrostis hirtigluma subsp. patula]